MDAKVRTFAATQLGGGRVATKKTGIFTTCLFIRLYNMTSYSSREFRDFNAWIRRELCNNIDNILSILILIYLLNDVNIYKI